MSDHRWSGWPGAICLDCGAQDQREACLAGVCGVDHDWFGTDEPTPTPPICPNQPCPEPGSGRFDPYREKGRT